MLRSAPVPRRAQDGQPTDTHPYPALPCPALLYPTLPYSSSEPFPASEPIVG